MGDTMPNGDQNSSVESMSPADTGKVEIKS